MATTTIDPGNMRGGLRRRISRVLYQRPRLRLALLLGGPIVWLLVAYVGSLVALLVPAGGVLHEVFGHSPGFGLSGTVLTLSYLWLPYMIIPIYAGLERLPNSLLEASTDLGAKAGRTFVRVVLPQIRPSIVAGSIFTFA